MRFPLPAVLLSASLPLAACGGNGPRPAGPARTPAPEAQEPAAPQLAEPEQRPQVQQGFPQEPAGQPADPQQVVAKVDGEEITEGDVQERLDRIVRSQSGGAPVSPEQLGQLRQSMGPAIVDQLVGEVLLDAEIDEEGIAPSEEDYRRELRLELESTLAFESMEREAFEARIQTLEGLTYDEFVEDRAADDDFRRSVRHARLIEERFPEEVAVSDEEVRERFEEDREAVWTRPALVRASHILFEVPAGDPEAAAAKRAEAERVLALAKEEGADFAALVRDHSEEPGAAERDGDLGFFPREGAMIEPFADAAFQLEEGEVSDLVETPFGLHVIKVHERTEPDVVDLEEAAPAIRRRIEAERIAAVLPRHVEELRADADVELM